MPVNCGSIEFVDGGVINNATMTNSTIQGSVINGSAIEASSLSRITAVDADTAVVIANVIAKLDTEQLRALAKAITDAMPDTIETALGPAHTKDDALPTELAGGRQYVLGSPMGWLKMQGVVIPAYQAQE